MNWRLIVEPVDIDAMEKHLAELDEQIAELEAEQNDEKRRYEQTLAEMRAVAHDIAARLDAARVERNFVAHRLVAAKPTPPNRQDATINTGR